MRIERPRPADAPELARLLLAAWLETYPDPAAGIDEAWIRAQRGDVDSPEVLAAWREFLHAVDQRPEDHFCRVVRARAKAVGLLCGSRRGEAIGLGPMYLLGVAQGSGIGGRLMDDFRSWAGPAEIRLWVTASNERAIRFYRRHGFELTGEDDLWRGRLHNVRMARAGSER